MEYILNLLTQNELTTLIMINSVGYYLKLLGAIQKFTMDNKSTNITLINIFDLSLRI